MLSMPVFAGAALDDFAVALTIRVCLCIYSSILLRVPIVMWIGVRREDLVKPVKERKQEAAV